MKKIFTAILSVSLILTALAGCSEKPQNNSSSELSESSVSSENLSSSEVSKENDDLTLENSMELKYAQNFKVDYLSDGFKLLTVDNHSNYKQEILLVPEGKEAPKESKFINENTIIIKAPVENLFVSSTPAVSLINAANALDYVKMTTYDAKDWYIDDIINAIEEGKIIYTGHAKNPDFEIISKNQPQLVIYNTKIDSYPEVREKLKELGLGIIVDYSSFEPHPMAKSEWIKFFGALLDKETEANAKFEEQAKIFENIKAEDSEKTVAIFYITSKNDLYVRKCGDYMVTMLDMAGGKYIFDDLEKDSTGTVKIDFETFYSTAKDADSIIYLWPMGGRPKSLNDLLAKNELLKDFKAVQNNNVWCTSPDYFQTSDKMGEMIEDIVKLVNNNETDDSEIKHLFKLQ